MCAYAISIYVLGTKTYIKSDTVHTLKDIITTYYILDLDIWLMDQFIQNYNAKAFPPVYVQFMLLGVPKPS